LGLNKQLQLIWKEAQGFSIHGYQAGDFPGIMEAISEFKPKVLWLYRKDRFKQGISCMIAHQSKEWSTRPDAQALKPKKFYLNMEKMVDFIEEVDGFARRDWPIFKKCEIMLVSYEELVEGSINSKILEFLNVAPYLVTPTTHLSRTNPDLSKYVPNWRVMQTKFDKRYNNRRQA